MPTIDERIRQMVDRIVAVAKPEKVILFGSQAWGTPTDDSDVDLLVVEKEPFSLERSRRKELLRVNMAIRECALAADILLYSSDELLAGQRISPLLAQVCREGKVLYARH
ncbi:MAG: nucleotidyltransferase domain-containing protein [Azonexus sp.]|nr:nucleotidyltransferase domain-containing protein [Azonexus sp.]MCK6412424.1 nucleotidyltransferase domain-containing protein [Azonexus sp.]